jgi:hypothetical protein
MKLQRKEIPKPRNFVKEKKSKHEIAPSLIYIES